MSLISLFIHGEYAQLLLSAVVLLATFYALGRIIQKYFRYNKSNIFISLPIGLIAFLIINQVVYTPIIITGLGVEIISIVDTLKAISLALFIVISYEAWFPRFNKIGAKTVGLSLLSVATVILIYGLSALTLNNFAVINSTWVDGINTIGENGVYNPMGDGTVMNEYQSTYYWLYLNSSFGDIEVGKVATVEMAIVWLSAITLAIQSTVVSNEKTILSFITATIISTSVAIALGFASPTNDLFYVVGIAIIITMILYDYAKRVTPSENSITMATLGSLAFITIGSYSFAYFLIFGLIAITLSSIRGGNIVRNTIHYLLTVLLATLYFVIAMFIHNINYIDTIFFYLIIIGVIFVLMFLPLYSIGYTPSRRKELVMFEESITSKIGIGVIVTTILITLLALFINFIGDSTTYALLRGFFSEFNSFNNNEVLGLLMYILIILIPSATIFIFWYFGKSNPLLSLFAFINALLNPVTISTLCTILNISFSGEIILIPSMLLLSIFILNEFTKRVPSLH